MLPNKEIQILELGCGRAYTSKYLYYLRYKNITACDFSKVVLESLKRENRNINVLLFDMTEGLPFENETFDLVIADLSIHYFDDKNHIPENSKLIEKNFYFDSKLYKRFFSIDELKDYLSIFKVNDIQQKLMDRYENKKILLEFCVQKIS